MKKITLGVCLLALLLGLCACGSSAPDANVAGRWVSPNRGTYDEVTYTNQLGQSVVLEENSTSNYEITFYDDGTYRAGYSYENIEYDYSSNPARRVRKSGTQYVDGTYTVNGNSVTMSDKTGTTKMTLENGVLKGPTTSNYSYNRAG